MEISNLLLHIQETHSWFSKQTARQINTALTLRNWVIGMYLRVYEHEGKDRAQYGEKVLSEISLRLKNSGQKGMSERSLRLYRYFYDCYPQIWQTLSAKFQIFENQYIKSEKLRIEIGSGSVSQTPEIPGTNPEILLNRLTFSHFIELLNCDTPLKRLFYETEAIVNNWSVRELRRAMDSLLFERTGLSTDKQKVLEKHRSGTGLNPSDVIKDPYVLEFLGLNDKPEYSESRVEQAIIDHLQQFLLEAGKGFCFEARQRRISFDNRHYRIDLVFYHRILRCHVLFDLKIGSFDHADAGQMNVYLNYYKEHEMMEGDLPPVGVILCSEKNQALVHYATGGLPQQVFASKYLLNLPTEEELKSIVMAEQEKAEKR